MENRKVLDRFLLNFTSKLLMSPIPVRKRERERRREKKGGRAKGRGGRRDGEMERERKRDGFVHKTRALLRLKRTMNLLCH